MNKSLRLVLSVLIALTLGLTLVHCGDDGDGDCDCGERVCGSPPGVGCAGVSCGSCGATEECNPDGQCVEDTCCPGEGDNFIYVKGAAVDFPTMTPKQGLALAPLSAFDVLSNPGNPTHLDDLVSGEQGAYETDCFDISHESAGLVILSDDSPADGAEGEYFPALTGVLDVEGDGRVCVDDAPPVYGFPMTLLNKFKGFSGLDQIDTKGFAILLILDADYQPVEGAVVKRPNDSDLNTVVYPDANLNEDENQVATSANGIVIVTDEESALVYVKPVKEGMTWPEENAFGMAKNYVFMRVIPAISNP